MENFIGKVIKIVSGHDKGVNNKDFWIDDSKCKACYECESAFSQWNRRHHCRICGRVFCGNCTRNSIPPPRESADQQWLRVCNYCYRVRQRSDQPAARVQHQHAGFRVTGASVLTHSGSIRSLPDAGSLSGAASTDGAVSSLAGCRSRSGAPLSRWSRGSTSMHRVSTGDLSWAVPPPLEDDFGMSLADRDARLLYKQQLEAGALLPDAPPQANSLAEVHRHLFCAAADAHLRAVVQQLLMAESVPQPGLWAPIVSCAAQAVAAYLSPAQMYANGQHDPRQSLKVKKVADVGRPEDTCMVTGVVVRKGLVHRKMRAYIEYPKVLLLAGSLEYQRETNKLSSFDLMDHDKQYLANAVARLAVVKPDVVLVEGSVARMAQEDLLSRNISVAQKIKMKVLERLARAMGVRVTPTVEHLNPSSAHLYLGDCKVFRVEAETINVIGSTSGADVAALPPSPLAAQEPTAAPGRSTAGSSVDIAHGCSSGNSAASVAEPPPAPTAESGAPLVSGAANHAVSAPGELSQGGFSNSNGAAAAATAASAPAPPRPPADDQQAKYTSLSAAMMMKALGSGPNAAAAVAAVSAGSGVVTSGVTSFPSWSSLTPTAASLASGTAPSVAVPVAASVGQGGGPVASASVAATMTAAAATVGSPHPTVGRTAPAPVPAGPPAPPQVTLMYFEGCRPITSTVLLKGAGLELLRRLKPVMSFAVLTAWNQRLESAFLSDLLTAAVAAAGEEAYAAAASAAGLGGGSACGLLSAASVCLGALQLSGAAQPAGPGILPGPAPSPAIYSPASLSLSLGFFRLHAEQAIRRSVGAASASGAPGILLSISPHCNAWDDSLIAEWEQQGFTFPQQHHNQHYPYLNNASHQLQLNGHEGRATSGVGAQVPLLKTFPRLEAQGQQGTEDGEAGRTADGPSLLQEPTLCPAARSAAGVGGPGAEGVQRTAAAMARASELQQLQKTDAAAAAAAVSEALEPFLQPPEYAHAPSATTLLSPFAAAAAAAAGSGAAAQQLPGPDLSRPQEPLQVQRSGSEPPGEASVAAGIVECSQDMGTATGTAAPRPEEAAGEPSAGAAAAAETPGGGSVDLSAARRGAAGTASATGGEAGMTAQHQQQSPAKAVQQGAQVLQELQPQHHYHNHQQQQSAVMVLQGQRIYNHQRIFVTCMFRRSRDRNLCDPFQVKQIDYYHRLSDVPLIRYIKMCTQQGWTCPGVGCPEPFTAHESVFFFGCHKLTIFYSTLPPIQALPGEEKNQIWHWTRPIGRGREGAPACRRVPLSQDACYISMGRFLELSFSADGLDVFGRSLHYDHVRYFGLGRTLVCMFPERTSVYVMQLPDVVMSYSQQAQVKWLRQEGAELAQEANDAFDIIELMLPESPHFGGAGWEVATYGAAASGGGPASAMGAVAVLQTVAGDVAAAGEAGTVVGAGFTPSSSPGAAAPAAAAAASAGLASLLAAVRKDRQSFLALVADCLARCAAAAPSPGPGAAVPWDDFLISGVRELNRLRAVLAKNVLQWASRLQDPAGFTAHYTRITMGGGAAVAAGRYAYRSQHLQRHLQPPPQQQQPAQPLLSSSPGASPLAAAIAADTDATAGPAAAAAPSGAACLPQQLQHPLALPLHAAAPFQELSSLTASEGSLSLFGATSPATAAYRLGLMAGQGQGHHPIAPPLAPASEATSLSSVGASENAGPSSDHPQLPAPHAADATAAAHALPIPIVPHTNGPLSVHAVAEMVAQQELRGGGELLEGSRALLGAAGGAVAALAAAVSAAAAAAHHTGAGSRTAVHSRGSSRSDQPTSSAAAAAAADGAAGTTAVGGGPPLQGHGGDGGRVAGQLGGSQGGSAPSGPSAKRLSGSALGRLSAGGGVMAGLDAAGLAGGAAHGASGPGGAGGGGARGTSLPRSVSVSTIGDMDMSYMAGIGGDSGAEDNDDGGDGREEADDEPDHDTFLAFMGSAPNGGLRANGAGRGPDGAGPRCRSSSAGDRGAGSAGGDIGDDVPDELADGAYYYRALFSHGVASEGGAVGEEASTAVVAVSATAAPPSQALLQPPQPLLVPAQALTPQRLQLHPLQHGEEEGYEEDAEQLGLRLPQFGAAANGVPRTGAAESPLSTLHASTALAIGTGATAATAEPMPLVPASEPFGGGSVGSAAATAFSRRQLMVTVRRRLESVAAATVGGGALARGFIPMPGRATLPPGVNDTIIPIFDGEPTSIIAYALSTRAYQQQINAGYKAIFGKARADGNRDRDREQASAAASAAAVATAPQPPQPLSSQGAAVLDHQQLHGAVGAAAGVQGLSQASTPASASAYTATAAAGAPGAALAPASLPNGALAITGQPGPPAAAAVATTNGASVSLAPVAPAVTAPPTSGSSALGSSPPLRAPLLPPPPPGALGSSPDAEWWTVLTSKEACHVRLAFEDEARSMPWARARFSVTAHFAPQFAELRRRCIQGGEAAFVASMCRCKRWESRGGKSNAYFAKTRDDRYIIKSLSKSEKASFMNFAPHYFTHMGRHLLNRDSPTCLAKILGVYSVAFKPQPGTAGLEGTAGGGPAGAAASAALIRELKDREFSQDLLVMENCFYDRPVARIYDLKGSERNRFNADAASRPEDHLEVHLDDNLRRSMHTNPIFVDARSRHAMEAAVWADTAFLAGQDVMDYSLLVGVDKENGVLALAIIDFIRQYTWDKQLETWVKSSGMLGGNGKEPTIISPKQYMRRFRAAMQQYFTAVPGSAGSEVPKDPDAAA